MYTPEYSQLIYLWVVSGCCYGSSFIRSRSSRSGVSSSGNACYKCSSGSHWCCINVFYSSVSSGCCSCDNSIGLGYFK